MKSLITTTAFAIVAIFSTNLSQAQEGHDHSDHAVDATAATAPDERVGDPWPLDTCVVAGMKLGSMGDPIVHLHEGREVRFCCAGCTGAFEADPESFLAKADATITEQQKEFYPLTNCIVDTPEQLSEDEADNNYVVVGNRLFILCCPGCEGALRADPAPYFEKLDKAVAEKQREDYPLDTCVVSGQALDSMGGSSDVVIANQLLQLCCEGCTSAVEEDPAGALAKIAEARNAS